MVDERLSDYFKTWKAKGYTEEKIKTFLLNRGYSQSVIDEAANASKGIVIPESIPPPPPMPSSKNRIILTLLIIVIVCVILFLAYFVFNDEHELRLDFWNAETTSSDSSTLDVKDMYSRNNTANNITTNNPSNGHASNISRSGSGGGSNNSMTSGFIDNNSISNVNHNFTYNFTSNTTTSNLNSTTNISNTTSNITNQTKIIINWSSSNYSGGSSSRGGSSRHNDEEETPAPSATCSDGSMNGDETGIDCGGSCTACACSGNSTQICDITNGAGSQNRSCVLGNWSDYSNCTVTSCNTNYTLCGNGCNVSARSCAIGNGTGNQSGYCSSDSWNWNECSIVSCDSGYKISNNSCILNITGFVVDHTSTNISSIPSCWINRTKEDLRIAYSHTSHGGQLIDGMRALATYSSDYRFMTGWLWPDSSWNSSKLYIREYEGYGSYIFPGINETSTLINASDISRNLNTWANLTREYLDGNSGGGLGENISVMIWTWGGTYNETGVGDSITPSIIQTKYLDKMEELINEYDGTNKRKVTFVLMTIHVYQWGGILDADNAIIREWCANNSDICILYDFADIEEHDPLGEDYTDRHVSQSLRYDCTTNYTWTCNWATDYLGTHTGTLNYNLTEILKYELTTAGSGASGVCDHSPSYNSSNYSQILATESTDSVLNCALKGQATWHLLTRIAGWDGVSATCD